MLTNEQLLRKAEGITTLADLGQATGGISNGPTAPLTIEQVRQFFRVAITRTVLLSDVRVVNSNANKWEESLLDFSARVLRPGSEGTRLPVGTMAARDGRYKPLTGKVEISTVLVRGEVPLSDEALEDQVEQEGFADTVMNGVAEAVGRDIEELMLNGDTALNAADPYLDLCDGWLKLAQGTGGNVYDAASDGQDYQTIFKRLLVSLPDRFKSDKPNMRFYVPTRVEEYYRDQLAARGTPLGDITLEGGRTLRYQEVEIRGVPIMAIDTGTTPDSSKILLTHRQNLYAGYRRQVRMETFRDPREGAMSIIVNARVAPAIGHVPATAIATNVDVE